jgi:hypothetical protein
MPNRIRWSDVFALSFWGCLILVLCSAIPLLTIIAGILTIRKGLTFWGVIIVILGVLALIGPFYAALTSKEKRDEKTGDG